MGLIKYFKEKFFKTFGSKMILVPIIAKVVSLPSYATEGSAGLDIRYHGRHPILLEPNERKLIPTGIFIAVPEGYEIQVRPRSGLALKEGITVLNSPGTIDSDYRQEVGVILINHSAKVFMVEPGMRVAQLVLQKVELVCWELVNELPTTERKGGFGSTGLKG